MDPERRIVRRHWQCDARCVSPGDPDGANYRREQITNTSAKIALGCTRLRSDGVARLVADALASDLGDEHVGCGDHITERQEGFAR